MEFLKLIATFFSENPNAWRALAFIVIFAIARRPTLRYIRMRVERNAANMEIDHYQILRREIGDLNGLLMNEQRDKRKCHEEKFGLMEKLDEQNDLLRDLQSQIKLLTNRP